MQLIGTGDEPREGIQEVVWVLWFWALDGRWCHSRQETQEEEEQGARRSLTWRSLIAHVSSEGPVVLLEPVVGWTDGACQHLWPRQGEGAQGETARGGGGEPAVIKNKEKFPPPR